MRRALSALNRALGKGFLRADRETVGLNPEQALWVDVAEFRRCLAACEAHEHREAVECPDCLAHLSEAVGLYRDDFLAGFSLADSLPFEEWGRYQAHTLRDELASALERLARWQGAQGDYEAAITNARRWLDPATPSDDLTPLLDPMLAVDVDAVPVSSHVNNARNKDPRCVEPIAAPVPVGVTGDTPA